MSSTLLQHACFGTCSDTLVIWPIPLAVQLVLLRLIEHLLVVILCIRLTTRLGSSTARVLATLFQCAIVLVDVHIVINLHPPGIVALGPTLFGFTLRLHLLLGLTFENLFELIQFQTLEK